MKQLLIMNKTILIVILSILSMMNTSSAECFNADINNSLINDYGHSDFSYNDRYNNNESDSIREWNREHSYNYIQKINNNFYVIPNTPHYIQTYGVSDTMLEVR